MAELLATIIALWGIIVPVHITEYDHDLNIVAYQYFDSDSCEIAIDSARWELYSPYYQRSILLHEYGHCLGLGHFGDCNSIPAIMGCATLGGITDYDRAKLHPAGAVMVVASDGR